MLNGGTVITQRRRTAHGGSVLCRDGIDRLATDTIVLAARQPLVRARRHALFVGANELELERRRAGVEHEDIHPASPETVRRDAAARARASASSAVSP